MYLFVLKCTKEYIIYKIYALKYALERSKYSAIFRQALEMYTPISCKIESESCGIEALKMIYPN